ncbi:MAG: DUF3369 domain-containing protein [Myxococcales bacterium]|nr:DUF3369 domain-containing protein [Myxococcales bacterium]
MVEHDDDALLFADEDEQLATSEGATPHADDPPWRVLVIDDEPEVHAITRLALADLRIEGRGIELLSAYTGAEARTLLEGNDEVALVLLDVVMESEHAGLALARWIREERRDHLVRIVLRTGQPGTAPEQQVMLEYDINDYRAKTELTAKRLVTTVVGALRSYRDLCVIDAQKRGLERVVLASATLFERRSFEEFLRGLLDQIAALLRPRQSAMFVQVSGRLFGGGDRPRLLAGTGRFREYVGEPAAEHLEEAAFRDLNQAIRTQHAIHRECYTVFGLCYRDRSCAAVYIETASPLSTWENHLLEVFCHNAAVALDNLRLHHRQLELLAAFERFVPKRLLGLAEIVDVTDAHVGDHIQREVAVAFADLRSFTRLAEALSPGETFDFINEFFAAIVPAIHDHGGVVDKFMGDGLMALFPRGAEDAVSAGLAMIEATKAFADRRLLDLPLLPRIAVGVHRGPIILGLVGAADRLDFTGISDGVNVAARIERLTRDFDADLLISGPIYADLPEALKAQSRPLGATEIRGKDREVEIYEVFAGDADDDRANKAATREPLKVVAAALRDRRWQDARDLLSDLRRRWPADHALESLDRHCWHQLLLRRGRSERGLAG